MVKDLCIFSTFVFVLIIGFSILVGRELEREVKQRIAWLADHQKEDER